MNRFLQEADCCILCFEGMTDKRMIDENIIRPVITIDLTKGIDKSKLISEMQKKVITISKATVETDIAKIVPSILYGDTLFLVRG